MQIVDLNLLLYAVNADSAHHAAAKRWLDRALSGADRIGFAWLVVLGFLRVATHERIFPRPLTHAEAIGVIDSWLDQPSAELVHPTDEHWRLVRSLLEEAGTAGDLTSDAHLAALAIERGADLASADSDFARFRGLRWVNPVA